jgi:hypothetical protein
VTVPYSDETPLPLYQYFPGFTKERDTQAGVDAFGEAVLQKVTYMLEKEAGAQSEMLRRLLVDLDVDNCDVSRLDYLAYILGVPIPGDLTDEYRRQYLRQLPDLIKLKGLHQKFIKEAAFRNRKDIWLVELWKTTENEDRNYERSPDAVYRFKAARVDMMSCSGSCESVCESICEEGFQLSGAYVNPSQAQEILNELGEVLPIHVVLRRQAQFIEPNEAFPITQDTLGCWTSCESICENVCETAAQVWPGSYTESNFRDLGPVPSDSWAFETVCINVCESVCQTCCECGQEGTCGTLCELTCQVVCAGVCQNTCMQSCQSACQDYCQDCQAGCQLTCQIVCVDTCETLCEVGVE